MVRKANGFLTNTGKFFDSRVDADIYEAIDGFKTGLHELLLEAQFTPSIIAYTERIIEYFVLANRDQVLAYIKHVDVTPEKPTLLPATDPVVIEDPFPGDMPITQDQPTFTLEESFLDGLDTDPAEELQDLDETEIHPDLVQTFEDTLGEDDPSSTETGDDEEVRLDGVRAS
jgi:hypothetical protein